MKTRRCSLFASLLSMFVLLLQFSPVLADGKARSARPFEVDFDKCFDRQGDAPYLFTFSGTASGDVSGTLEAGVAVFIPNVQPNQNHLQADYVVAGHAEFHGARGWPGQSRRRISPSFAVLSARGRPGSLVQAFMTSSKTTRGPTARIARGEPSTSRRVGSSRATTTTIESCVRGEGPGERALSFESML